MIDCSVTNNRGWMGICVLAPAFWVPGLRMHPGMDVLRASALSAAPARLDICIMMRCSASASDGRVS